MHKAEDEFAVWVQRSPRRPGQLEFRGALLKKGTQVAKLATYATYGDTGTGEVRRRELAVKTVPRRPDGSGYNFNGDDVRRWYCENEEIERLLAFLDSDVESSGRYVVVDTASPIAALVKLAESKNVDAASIAGVLASREDIGKVVEALAGTAKGRMAAQSAVLSQRRELVAELKAMAIDPSVTETDLQHQMGNSYWLFGGRYVGVADRRNLAPLDQHDIPLITADGTLHIVELKGPCKPNLIHRYRNHYIVGTEVHEATSQAINYIRSLDGLGASLSTIYRNEFDLDYDFQRVFATVVIGHPAHIKQADRHAVGQTIRSYNAHLARVQVITYSELFDAAERALNFEDMSLPSHSSSADKEAGSKFSEVRRSEILEDPCEHERGPWSDEPPF